MIALRNPENPPSDTHALLPRLGRLGTGYITRSVVYLETLSCSLSLAFLAEVTGRGYQREGFSGFLRAITVTERAIARSVDCECPISAATSDSVRAVALRLGNSLPYTDTSRLVPRPVRFVAQIREYRSLHLIPYEFGS